MTSRIAALTLLAACGGSKLPTTTLSVGGHAVTVEIVADEAQRAQGLMHRDHLPADRGMLFVYDDDAVRGFWMKDTRIPLSIAFLDRHGTIVRIADMRPLDTSRTSSLYPARYALEVNQGWFRERGIEAGAKVEGLDRVGRQAPPGR